jgi:hypothetical protein
MPGSITFILYEAFTLNKVGREIQTEDFTDLDVTGTKSPEGVLNSKA